MAPPHAARAAAAQAANDPRKYERLPGAFDNINTEGSQRKQHVAHLHAEQRGNLYEVSFDGEVIVRRSREPELDLARALLARGITGSVAILDGKTGRSRTTINLERAAKLSVREGPLRFVPFQSRPNRSPAAETRSAPIPAHEWWLRRPARRRRNPPCGYARREGPAWSARTPWSGPDSRGRSARAPGGSMEEARRLAQLPKPEAVVSKPVSTDVTEKRKAYMRDLMRKRREKEKG